MQNLTLALVVFGAALLAASVAQAQTSPPPVQLAPPVQQPAPLTVPPTIVQPVVVPILVPSPPLVPAQPPTYARPYRPYRARPRVVGWRTEERPQMQLVVPGLIALGIGYLGNLLLTGIANGISDDRDPALEEDALAWGLIPLVGPAIQLSLGAPHPAVPLATGLIQLTGLGLLVYGLTSQRRVRVPIHEGDPDDPHRVELSAVPTPGGGMVSLTVSHP